MEIAEAAVPVCDVSVFQLKNFESVFAQVLEEFLSCSGKWRHSHKIGGRWENTYPPIEQVPSVRSILSLAATVGTRSYGSNLVCGHGILKDSFWFNQMDMGEGTGWHDHKAKAALSGVCYLKVPRHSGDFLYQNASCAEQAITPGEGMLLLFPPTLRHAVASSQSPHTRISLAFNLFTLPLEMGADDPFGGHSLMRG